MAKHIIFCADGTWNTSSNDANKDGSEPSNVYRLFCNLQGINTVDEQKEKERELKDENGLKQIAKYLHGIGADTNPMAKKAEGYVGFGIIGRIVRGYTFISRNYEPGDEVSIVGFSRGAYTARALTGLIVCKGLLPQDATKDKDKAYDIGIEVWYRYWAKTSNATWSAKLWEYATNPLIFAKSLFVKDDSLIQVDHINTVGVWDTVGALGIPNEIFGGARVDHFKFADTKLSVKVQAGFHAVSLDEQREDFIPTLWDEGPGITNVTQELFPGAHSDVGGGYPIANGDAGLLSDIALTWMMEHLKGREILFTDNPQFPLKLCVNASAHEPWKGSWCLHAPRNFPAGMKENQAIMDRIACGPVKADPSEQQAAPYAPSNRPK